MPPNYSPRCSYSPSRSPDQPPNGYRETDRCQSPCPKDAGPHFVELNRKLPQHETSAEVAQEQGCDRCSYSRHSCSLEFANSKRIFSIGVFILAMAENRKHCYRHFGTW